MEAMSPWAKRCRSEQLTGQLSLQPGFDGPVSRRNYICPGFNSVVYRCPEVWFAPQRLLNDLLLESGPE